MKQFLFSVALVALWALVPLSSVAQNQVTGITATSHATFNNVGIMVSVSGDDNGDATAQLEVSVDGGDFQEGHPLSRTHDDRFVGSAFFLPEGVNYEVRVTLNDPDGVSGGTLTSTGSTRTSTVPSGPAAEYHVSPDGDDSNPGSETQPMETIAAAIQAAGSGDTITVHEGTYHEEVNVTSGGEPGAPLVLRAAPEEPVIMSGASPSLQNPEAWTGVGGGVYSAPVAATRYVAVDDLRMWRYESLEDLQSLSEGTDGGFFHDGATVYLRLPADATPEGHQIEVSVLGRGLWIENSADVVVRGITFRCYGGEEYSEGIMVRDGSHRVWIVGNTFEHVMPGIWVKNEVDDLVVMDNEFSDRGLPEFPWHAVKAQGGMESGAIAVDGEYDGQGIIFANNYVHNSFDGINICGNNPMEHPNNADVTGNTFSHLADDGIETDGDCSNIRILLNRFEDSLVGVSTAPAAVGPTYVIRNLMVDLNNVASDSDWMTRALKFNVDDPRPSGDVFVYHNTASTFEEGQPAFGVTDESQWTNVALANNIWYGAEHSLYYVNTGDDPFTEEYDLLYSPSDHLVYFQGDHYASIEDYNSATGLCQGCVDSDPLLVNPSGGDYRPQETSPAIDSAWPIPGINDDFTGDGPDIGAHELGGAGPDADIDSDVDGDSDADTDGGTNPEAFGDGDKPPDHSSCSCLEVGRSPKTSPILTALLASAL